MAGATDGSGKSILRKLRISTYKIVEPELDHHLTSGTARNVSPPSRPVLTLLPTLFCDLPACALPLPCRCTLAHALAFHYCTSRAVKPATLCIICRRRVIGPKTYCPPSPSSPLAQIPTPLASPCSCFPHRVWLKTTTRPALLHPRKTAADAASCSPGASVPAISLQRLHVKQHLDPCATGPTVTKDKTRVLAKNVISQLNTFSLGGE